MKEFDNFFTTCLCLSEAKGMIKTMCGLYYVNDDTAREIEKLIRQVDEKMRKAENIHLQAGDIRPSEVAPVITANHNYLHCRWQRWGFPSFSGKQLNFNARSESA